MDYGIGRAHKIGGGTEIELTKPMVLIKNLQPLHIVTAS